MFDDEISIDSSDGWESDPDEIEDSANGATAYADFNRGRVWANESQAATCDEIYLEQLSSDFAKIIGIFYSSNEPDAGWETRVGNLKETQSLHVIMDECNRLKRNPALFPTHESRTTFMTQIATLARSYATISRTLRTQAQRHELVFQRAQRRHNRTSGVYERPVEFADGVGISMQPLLKQNTWKDWLRNSASDADGQVRYSVNIPAVGIHIQAEFQSQIEAIEAEFVEHKALLREGPRNDEQLDLQDMARATGLDYSILYDAEPRMYHHTMREGKLRDMYEYDSNGHKVMTRMQIARTAQMFRHPRKRVQGVRTGRRQGDRWEGVILTIDDVP